MGKVINSGGKNMYRYEDQKDMRKAMNGRMVVMIGGLFLIMTAVTSTLLQGIQFLFVANAAGNGDVEAIELAKKTSLSVGQLYGLGISSMVMTVVQIMSGVILARFSNRLQKTKICLYADYTLIGATVLEQVYMMILNRVFNPIPLLAGSIIPLAVLWGIMQLKKIAKKYPERPYAVETTAIKNQMAARNQKKNLMARAKAKVRDEEKVSRVIDEIQDTPAAEETK